MQWGARDANGVQILVYPLAGRRGYIEASELTKLRQMIATEVFRVPPAGFFPVPVPVYGYYAPAYIGGPNYGGKPLSYRTQGYNDGGAGYSYGYGCGYGYSGGSRHRGGLRGQGACIRYVAVNSATVDVPFCISLLATAAACYRFHSSVLAKWTQAANKRIVVLARSAVVMLGVAVRDGYCCYRQDSRYLLLARLYQHPNLRAR